MNDNKNLTIEETFNLAVKNHREGKTDNAQELYNQILKINPNHSAALNNIGIIFIDLGKNQKAKECYGKAIKINPNYANAHYNLGNIFKKLGENQKAIDCFKKAIEINPDYADAHNNLAVVLMELGENQRAKDCYEKAIKINPNYIAAHNNLGNLFLELGENQRAKSFFEKAIAINPNNVSLLNNIANLICFTNFSNLSKNDILSYKDLSLFLFKKNNIDHNYISTNSKSTLLFNGYDYPINEIFNSDSKLLMNQDIQKLLKEELFYLMLQKSLIPDHFIEKLLTKLRNEMLFDLENSIKNNLKEYFDFIISLAEQCWLNEFVYFETEKEINQIIKLKNKIEKNKKVNELEIAVLGCYIPLNSSKNIIDKLLNYKSSNLLFNDLINVQIKEPLKELELKKSIKSLDKITDAVSKNVQEQYEEHPFPRWRYCNAYQPVNFLHFLNDNIKPNKVIFNNEFNNPKVLIAGCGTGSHTISVAKYQNANILAIDLSLSSLAYSRRKTDELGFKNIEYLHADILQLNKLNRKFDIIESSGVLHHMKDPIAGLKVLLDVLEPHGYLKLGLYSEKARQNVVETRKFIKNKNYKNTREDIKILRQEINNKKGSPLMHTFINKLGFYSTSIVRDLLFHVQEQNFTIPEISKILKDLNLEFLGFVFSNSSVNKKFSSYFPKDKKNISLDNWHQFEINNPNTFNMMYQFWIRKL